MNLLVYFSWLLLSVTGQPTYERCKSLDIVRTWPAGTLGGDESRLRSGRPYQRRSSGGVAALNRSRQTRSRSHGARKSLEAIAAKRQGAVVSELQQRIVKRTRSPALTGV